MLITKVFVTITIFIVPKCGTHSKNVCSNLMDYPIIQFSKNCWYNPDVGSTAEEIIRRHGYPFESSQIVTEDGYKLGLFRIPNNGRPVFLQHGLACTSVAYLSLGNNSLAFKLYNAGFDVWLGNFRGTIYSNEHIKENIADSEYWNFSFYEMGFYDLPAMIDFVANKNKDKIIYIGHSMGTTASFVYSITRQAHAEEKLAALIALAPVAFMKHVYLPFGNLAPISGAIQTVANVLNIYNIGVANNEKQTQRYEDCLYSNKKLRCEIVSTIILALNLDSVPPEILPLFLAQTPAGTSLKNLRHYSQEIVADGQFRYYDYENLNQEKYGTEEPPVFNVTRIRIPVYLFYGKKDSIADEQDVLKLYETLQTEKYIINISEDHQMEFTHLDFLFSRNMDYLYGPLLNVVKNITSMQDKSI